MEFCTYCGQPLDPITGSCPLCGGGTARDMSGWFIDSLKQKLRSPLFLVFSIILTSSSLLAILDSGMLLLGLVDLVIPICLWITYFSACSSKEKMSLGGIKLISAVITIIRILLWVLFSILIVFAILLFAAPALFSDLTPYFTLMLEDYALYAENIGSVIMVVLGTFVVVLAIIIAIINIFFYGCISKSIKSVIISFKTGENRLSKFGAVKGWLIVFSVLECIVTLATFSISTILVASAYIIAAILCGKIAKTSPDDLI